jgi:hypothetical protein
MCPLGGTRYGMYAAKWAYGTRMPVLNVRTWPRGDVPRLEIDRLGRRSSKGGGL